MIAYEEGGWLQLLQTTDQLLKLLLKGSDISNFKSERLELKMWYFCTIISIEEIEALEWSHGLRRDPNGVPPHSDRNTNGEIQIKFKYKNGERQIKFKYKYPTNVKEGCLTRIQIKKSIYAFFLLLDFHSNCSFSIFCLDVTTFRNCS